MTRHTCVPDWHRRLRVEFRPEDDMGVADVIHFGYYNQPRAESGLEIHEHRGAMEFCYLVRGRQTYRVGGIDYHLAGGDMFLTFPDEPHSSGGAPQEKGVLFWTSLRLPTNVQRVWLGLPMREAEALCRALREIPTRHFPGSWQIRFHLEAMMDRLMNQADPLRTTSLLTHLGAMLLEIVNLGGMAKKKIARRRQATLAPIARHIEEHLDTPIPLSALAARARLSLPRFKARFKEEFGVPPGEYALRARVAEAQRRLETTALPVTSIAFDLGFSSSQYFATVFKRYTRLNPREIRRKGGA